MILVQFPKNVSASNVYSETIYSSYHSDMEMHMLESSQDGDLDSHEEADGFGLRSDGHSDTIKCPST